MKNAGQARRFVQDSGKNYTPTIDTALVFR